MQHATPSIQAAEGYRPDVDGLRAVAVLAVVIFHFNENWLPGGFAGVDIFFVISGFLITRNIAVEYASGSFSISRDSTADRIKRILPALSVVVFVTLIAGIFILTPSDLIELSQSAIASLLFVANVFFYQTLDTSYFADGSNTLPLLHIWSLGVEEQFYAVWPFLLGLMLLRLRGARLVATLLLVVLASFLFAQLLLPEDPAGAYYRLTPRIGELLAGAIACFLLLQFKWRGQAISRNLLGLLGLAAVAFSLFFITEDGGYPGFRAAPVTLGVSLLLFAGGLGGHWVRAVLAIGPLVWVGLISYSLYLWHWPVLAFTRYAFGDLSVESGIVATAVIFLLSIASYYLVEKRTRFVSWQLGRVFATFFAVPTVLVIASELLASRQ